jgi:hypothetical protein
LTKLTRTLGFTSVPNVGILPGGLIQFLSADRRGGQVILYPDGQLFARILAPKGQVAGVGMLSASPGRVDSLPGPAREHSGGRVRDRRWGLAMLVSSATWHGAWPLYTPHRGRAVLIDTAASQRIIRLPSTLPDSNGRMVWVQAISWR